ncbi:MAG: phage portal protein [Ignavibacteria bacterium]
MSFLSRITDFITGRGVVTQQITGVKTADPAFWNEFFGINSSNAISVTPESSLSFGAIYSVVDRKSSTLASLPSKIYKKEGRSRLEASDHDQYVLLSKYPNRLYTSFAFKRTLFANYELWGDGFAKIIRNAYSGRPVAYELIEPYKIEVYIGVDAGQKYLYYKNTETDEIIFDYDMIHISDLNLNGLRGKSKIKLHAESIQVGMSATRMGRKLYENGLFLGGYLKYAKTLTTDQLNKYRSSFADTYSGMQNAGKVGALDEGTTFEPLKYTMPLSDVSYIETRNFQIEDIARIFNYPIELLSGSKAASFSSLENIMINYVQSSLTPIATMFEQELNRKIFRSNEIKDHYTKLELNGLLRGDIKSRSAYYKMRFDTGSMSPNEIRQYEDDDPVEGGDQYFIPVNNLMPLNKTEEYFSKDNSTENKTDNSDNNSENNNDNE